MNNYFNKYDKEILFTIALIICIILTGIVSINNDNISFYIFGFIFFISGHFVGMNVPRFGLIFLFSHSLTGLLLMSNSLLGDEIGFIPTKLINNPILSDNPTNLYILILAILILFALAMSSIIIYNLSDKFKKIKYSKCIPLLLYTIGFLLLGILSRSL